MGLKIYTPIDLVAHRLVRKALRQGLKEVDKRQGWRGPRKSYPTPDRELFRSDFADELNEPSQEHETYPALVLSVRHSQGTARVLVEDQEVTLSLRSASWARRYIQDNKRVLWIKPEQHVRKGDVIEVFWENVPPKSAKGQQNFCETQETKCRKIYKLDQTPALEGAAVLLDPNSGRVLAMVGGYSYKRSPFNRVTQSYRQPGSAFKPVVYLAAIDGFQYTPATIVYDSPRTFKVGDQYWSPGNFDDSFLGGIPLRLAWKITKSCLC